jgi:predicted nucleic acid-binding protein
LTRYLLDTNIVSNPAKPAPSASLLEWMTLQADEDLFIASTTIAEIWRGVLRLPIGRRRRDPETWFAGSDGLRSVFAGRILAFDEIAAMVWARPMTEGDAIGRPRSPSDMVIAAVAEANDCVVVTDNERDFDGPRFLNPMRSTR